MSARQLGRWLVAVVGAVIAVVGVASSELLSKDAAIVVDDSAQLVGGSAATALCWWTSRRLSGPERTWRRLMAVGMAGWTVGMFLWAWYRTFSDTPLPSPSLADVGFFTLPVLALPALLALAVEPPRHPSGGRSASLVFVLDSLVVVGSLFIITWATALGAVVDAGAPTTEAFLVAIGYPVTDLVLVVMVVLLAFTRLVPPRLQTQLWLLGSGLVMLSVSDSIFAYLVSSGAEEMPPVTDAGFIAGPAFIALAAVAPAQPLRASPQNRAGSAAQRIHLLLPVALVAVTGAVVAIQMTLGDGIDRVETSIAAAVVVLVVLRQALTILENSTLLEQVSATQAELTYRAHHDPLTGLANRSLFNERLQDVVERRRSCGQYFALLLIDLDDFKAINDSLGHDAGDRLLHAVGERLRYCVREGDTVARLGGDEFAVVLEGDAEMPGNVGERILKVLREPFHIDGRMLSVGASVGVVEPDGEERDLQPNDVLRRADGAMYAGKRRGKGVVVRYDPDLLTRS